MSAGRLAAAIAAVALLVAAVEVAPAAAAPPPPADLQVSDGDSWHASNGFSLQWRLPEQAGGAALVAVHYLLKDPVGAVVVPDRRVGWPATQLNGLRVPAGPGAYTAEVRLEDAAGSIGPPAMAKLRYDDTRPAATAPLLGPGWIGRAEIPFTVRLRHPAEPAPPAGIRGYAVSIDRQPEAEPCDGATRCADAETDLRGGAGEDALAVAELPEGTSYVHAVAVSGSGMRSAGVGHALLRVDRTDPVTRLSGAPAGWTDHSVVLIAAAADAASGMRPDGEGHPFTAIRIDEGAPAIAAGDTVAATVIEAGSHTISYYAGDAAGNTDDGRSSNGRPNPPPATVTVRIDRTAPTVSFAASRDPADPESIVARVTDPLSGADPGRGQIAARPAGSGDLFSPLPTRVASGALLARWDSDAHPAGDYEFRATGFDRAGNSTSSRRRTGGSPMILHSPMKSPVALNGGLGGGWALRRKLELPYGRGAGFGGRLEDAVGSPLAGMPVRVVERFEPASGLDTRVTEALTGGDGRFRVHLPPGPSRDVVAVFDGNGALTRAVSEPTDLDVRAGTRLSASSSVAVVGGKPLEFRGAVAGDGPVGDVTVQLEFRLPSARSWTEFRTLLTNRRGRFRYRYRFSDDDSRGVRFLFRAFVPTQSDWPYEPGGSRPVAVRGR